MLIIGFEDLIATWLEDKWTSEVKEFADLLNSYLPEFTVSSLFVKFKNVHGFAAEALKSISFLNVKIIKNTTKKIQTEKNVEY